MRVGQLTSKPLLPVRSVPTKVPTITVADRNDKLCCVVDTGKLNAKGKPDRKFFKIGRRITLSNGFQFVYADRHNSWTLTRPDGSKSKYIGDRGLRAAWAHCPQIIAAIFGG